MPYPSMKTSRVPWAVAMSGRLIGCLLAIQVGCSGRLRGGPLPTSGAESSPERGPVPGWQSCDLAHSPPPILSCGQTQCGSNSSYMTGFALGALNLDGCRNRGYIRIVPESLRAPDPRCPQGQLRLDVIDGEIIGRRPGSDAAPTCAGAALAGATFWVEEGLRASRSSGTAEIARRHEIRIRAVGAAALFDDGHPPLRSYAIEMTGAGLAIDDVDSKDPSSWHDIAGPQEFVELRKLCPQASQWMTPWPAPRSPTTRPPPRDRPAESVDQFALAIAGETYFDSGKIDAQVGSHAPRWFHLACAGSALAKARLMGYEPQSGASTPDERMSTLKMLTATYCDKSYTVSGVPIFMTARAAAASQESEPRVGPIEARWTAAGASCISHSRLWREGVTVPADLVLFPTHDDDGVPVPACCTNEAEFVDKIRAICRIPACPATWSGADEHWTTFTVDHIAH
jgi:hypothetical protein